LELLGVEGANYSRSPSDTTLPCRNVAILWR
jgi:hypothetical protein